MMDNTAPYKEEDQALRVKSSEEGKVCGCLHTSVVGLPKNTVTSTGGMTVLVKCLPYNDEDLSLDTKA